MRTHHRRWRPGRGVAGIIGAVALGAAMTACEEKAPLDPLGQGDALVAETELQEAGVREVLEVHPAKPVPGDTLVLRSTVVYEGDDPARLESRLCGLDLRTDGFHLAPVTACEAYSRSRLVSPGDTFHQEKRAVLEAEPGVHDLEARHLLNPEIWSELTLRVR